jgi:hypothetical protein
MSVYASVWIRILKFNGEKTKGLEMAENCNENTRFISIKSILEDREWQVSICS